MPLTKPNQTSFKPGKSGNPKGRPPSEESMSGIMRQIMDMTPEEINTWLPATNPLGKAFAEMPRRATIKTLLVLRLIQSQMFDPNGVMTREIFDRLEGRVPFRAEVDGKLTVEGLDAVLDKVYGQVVEGEIGEHGRHQAFRRPRRHDYIAWIRRPVGDVAGGAHGAFFLP